MKKCISKVLTLFSCKNRYSFAYAHENQPSNIDLKKNNLHTNNVIICALS